MHVPVVVVDAATDREAPSSDVPLSLLTTDSRKAGTRVLVHLIVSFANLIRPHLAGTMIARGDGMCMYAFVLGGAYLCIRTLLLTACLVAKGGFGFATVKGPSLKLLKVEQFRIFL